MRDPRAKGWPNAGERTELRDVAERWKWAYVDHYRTLHHERITGVTKPRLLKQAVREYLAERSGVVAPNTAQNDRSALAHLTDDFGDAPLYAVDPQRTLNRLLREKYRPHTVHTYSMYLSGFWKWCGLEYRVTLPKWQRREPRVWTNEEAAALRKAASPGLLVAIDCGLYMGLRFGEIMGLEWSDVDISTWTVRVRRQAGGQPLKSRKVRTAVILPGWAHKTGTGQVAAGVTREHLRALLKRAEMQAAGVGWHTLRHTYARMFLEAKPDMRLLQASLGHSSVTVTEQAYNWLMPDKAAELARVAIHGR